jgi:hypothetical protein
MRIKNICSGWRVGTSGRGEKMGKKMSEDEYSVNTVQTCM